MCALFVLTAFVVLFGFAQLAQNKKVLYFYLECVGVEGKSKENFTTLNWFCPTHTSQSFPKQQLCCSFKLVKTLHKKTFCKYFLAICNVYITKSIVETKLNVVRTRYKRVCKQQTIDRKHTSENAMLLCINEESPTFELEKCSLDQFLY